MNANNKRDAITGCILGCAVGDALGLPFEGVSARRIKKFVGNQPLRHRFLFGSGMISDDTEHTCMVAQCLVDSAGDVDKFSKSLAWRMRWWFIGLPAGIGLGTLRASLKLWLGFPARCSGVNSAGNGPMMRSAIIGVYAADDSKRCQALITANTRLTHLDPRAERAAQIVARLAAALSKNETLTEHNVLTMVLPWINEDAELKALVEQVIDSVNNREDALTFCQNQGMKKGVSGYCYATLKVALQIVMRHPADYEAAVSEAILCGGDTDTLAAIVGSIVGAGVGEEGIPQQWLNGVNDWPRSVGWMRRLAEQLALIEPGGKGGKALKVIYPFVMLRNAFFMIVVILHGVRRGLPPY